MFINFKTDYYDILGVDVDASYDKIKEVYNEYMTKYHPNENDDPEVTKEFRKMTEAYKTLSDPYKRGKYDA
jgi:molecular chaperone DnaJ